MFAIIISVNELSFANIDNMSIIKKELIIISKLTESIFRGGRHKLSSPFGPRARIRTAAGTTSSFHNGADYSTFGKKLPQFAVAEGRVKSCGRDEKNGGALFVWVSYPSLGVEMLHCHLDSICVKAGQKVTEGTMLGTTGKTGKATGVHLHLGVRRRDGGAYIDPEKFSAEMNLIPQPGCYRVNTAYLHVRSGPGTEFEALKFDDFSADARRQIKKLNGSQADYYVRGVVFGCSRVREAGGRFWGKTPSGWVALDYCGRLS